MAWEMIQRFIERAFEEMFTAFLSWENFMKALAHVPKVFVNLSNGLAWPYLLSSLLLAWGIYLVARRDGAVQARSFREFAFPADLYRHPSTKLDFRFMAVDLLLTFLLFVPLFSVVGLAANKMLSIVIVDQLGWEPPHTMSPSSIFLLSVAFLALTDFVNYWAHVWFHKSPILWPFHQVHHSAEVLTPAAAYRVHPIENLVIVMLQAPVAGLSALCFRYILGPDREFMLVFGVSIIGFIYALMGTHLRHSHIWFSYGPWLDRVVMCPAHHQIHHSIDPCHWNKNFGVKFTVWDACFGTLYQPGKPEALRVGLLDAGLREFSTVRQLYFAPFGRAWDAAIGGKFDLLSFVRTRTSPIGSRSRSQTREI
jgi:sterol desaturase/sphingolipid hydroxylase (fatty acid hydroxylase superfamily)